MNGTCSFEIVRTLGVGGAATVYLARLNDGRDVAVKQLHAFLNEDPGSVAALEDEVRLTDSVRHPNVVRMIGMVEGTAGAPAVVMEWVEGVDLSKVLRAASRTNTQLPLDVVSAIACNVLAGLHAAHEAKTADGVALEIIHRDVSPQNVLVGVDGSVRVTDFGVAKAADRLEHTEQGAIKGKLGYLAPEQLAGECDRRTDVFAVGAMVWELLTGSRMRMGDGVEMLVQIVTGRSDAPSAQRPDAACLDAIVSQALDTIPELRFATAHEMAEAIAAAVAPASQARVAAVVAEVLLASETAETIVPPSAVVEDVIIPTLAPMTLSPTSLAPAPLAASAPAVREVRNGERRAEVGVRKRRIDPDSLDVERVGLWTQRTETRRRGESELVVRTLHGFEDVTVLGHAQADGIGERSHRSVDPFFEKTLRTDELLLQLVGRQSRQHAMRVRM